MLTEVGTRARTKAEPGVAVRYPALEHRRLLGICWPASKPSLGPVLLRCVSGPQTSHRHDRPTSCDAVWPARVQV
jgi:hypothetical protein